VEKKTARACPVPAICQSIRFAPTFYLPPLQSAWLNARYKRRKSAMALKSMSVVKLRDLREKVDAAIAEKVTARRHELEAELSWLARIDGRGATKTGHRRGPRGPVAPKYRNPKEPLQTWAGRGLQPLWLKTAIKSGKRLESFLRIA
jgi:DNA-binding protein H-NS